MADSRTDTGDPDDEPDDADDASDNTPDNTPDNDAEPRGAAPCDAHVVSIFIAIGTSA
jgi:hypothetical protein